MHQPYYDVVNTSYSFKINSTVVNTSYSFKINSTLNAITLTFLLMRAIGSILHGGPFEVFLIPASICFLVCEMVHIKQPLLLTGKNSPCIGSSGFHLIMLNAS